MGRLTDLQIILCQKRYLKRGPGEKVYLPFVGPWVPYLAKIPRRGAAEAEKGGLRRGVWKKVHKRSPFGTLPEGENGVPVYTGASFSLFHWTPILGTF